MSNGGSASLDRLYGASLPHDAAQRSLTSERLRGLQIASDRPGGRIGADIQVTVRTGLFLYVACLHYGPKVEERLRKRPFARFFGPPAQSHLTAMFMRGYPTWHER